MDAIELAERGVLPDWLVRLGISGAHYARTLEAWLAKCDEQRAELLRLFESMLGRNDAACQLQRWRMFFMACAELFNYGGGSEWFVSHYLFSKRAEETRVE